MIWGATIEAERERRVIWRRYFALTPINLDDGRRAWLCWIERRWWEDTHANWAGDSSRWEYRAIPSTSDRESLSEPNQHT